MPVIPRLARLLALLLVALQLSSRFTATMADARVLAELGRAAAEGRLVHVEDARSAECARVHEPDCELCRAAAASAEPGPASAPPADPDAVGHAVALAGARPGSPYAGPESARPPPVA